MTELAPSQVKLIKQITKALNAGDKEKAIKLLEEYFDRRNRGIYE